MKTKAYVKSLKNVFATMCLRSLRLIWRPGFRSRRGIAETADIWKRTMRLKLKTLWRHIIYSRGWRRTTKFLQWGYELVTPGYYAEAKEIIRNRWIRKELYISNYIVWTGRNSVMNLEVINGIVILLLLGICEIVYHLTADTIPQKCYQNIENRRPVNPKEMLRLVQCMIYLGDLASKSVL